MTDEEERTDIVQIEEAWGLVDELGDLSLRLKRAALAASRALGLPEEETE